MSGIHTFYLLNLLLYRSKFKNKIPQAGKIGDDTILRITLKYTKFHQRTVLIRASYYDIVSRVHNSGVICKFLWGDVRKRKEKKIM